MVKTVLSVILEDENLLMVYKKKGQGKGLWNIPGGKVEKGENSEHAAIRETKEETGLISSNLIHVGNLDFYLEGESLWSSSCKVFFVGSFSGVLIPEIEECRTQWTPIKEIPWDRMWACDRFWLPLAIEKKFFEHSYRFDKNNRLISK